MKNKLAKKIATVMAITLIALTWSEGLVSVQAHDVDASTGNEIESSTEPEIEVIVVQDYTNTEANGDLVEIEDEDTPLAGMDMKAGSKGYTEWILLAGVLATAAWLVFAIINRRKNKIEAQIQE